MGCGLRVRYGLVQPPSPLVRVGSGMQLAGTTQTQNVRKCVRKNHIYQARPGLDQKENQNDTKSMPVRFQEPSTVPCTVPKLPVAALAAK